MSNVDTVSLRPFAFSSGQSESTFTAGARVMPASNTVSMSMFQWIVSGLVCALVFVVWFLLSGIKTDVDGIRKDLSGLQVETIKAIGSVEKQIVESNGQLRALIQETRQRR